MFLLILAAGGVHRLLFLGRRQLWTDELVQALIGRASSPTDMITGMKAGMYLPAPLDLFIQKAVVLLLGESNFALRLHAVAFGTLSIWIFYRIAEMLFGRRVAIYSSFLFAFFPLQYHFSQEGGPYALTLFLTLLAYELLLRRIQGRGGRWTGWLSLCTVLVLLLYSSFFGLLVIGCQAAGLLLTTRSSPARSPSVEGADDIGQELRRTGWPDVMLYGMAALVAVSSFLPWIRFAWERPLMASPSEIADPRLPLRIIKELGDHSYAVSILILAGATAGVRALLRHARLRTLIWLGAWLLPSIPVLLALEYWSGYFFAIGQLLPVAPPLIFLAGYGLSYVGERMTILNRLPYQPSAPAILYAGLFLLSSVWIGANHWTKEHADWQGTARYLAQAAQPGVAISIPEVYSLLEYYEPQLRRFLTSDLDPGPGSLALDAVSRRIVVCYDYLHPDPCEGFRAPALADKSWAERDLAGFHIFIRERATP